MDRTRARARISASNESESHASPQAVAETLPSLRLRVEEWHMEWGPETDWSYRFNEALSQSREQGQAAVDKFFTDCERHAREGRQLIQSLRSTARWGILGHKEHVRDSFLQIYDLLSMVLSEVKFLETKLEEYAPAVPSTKITSLRHYIVD